jgi:hypothetical protein
LRHTQGQYAGEALQGAFLPVRGRGEVASGF